MRGKEERCADINYEKVHGLLKDFLNLKVEGLLPDPKLKKEGEMMYETQ